MNKVFIEGVRCFYHKETIPLRPLTLLVGENSTGKSTCLALIRLIWDMAQLDIPIISAMNFNEEPFNLGSYDQIASFKGGKAGRVREFSMGFESEVDMGTLKRNVSLIGCFIEHEGQPRLKNLKIKTDAYQLILTIEPKKEFIETEFTAPSGIFKNTIPIYHTAAYHLKLYQLLRFTLDGSISFGERKKRDKTKLPKNEEIDYIDQILNRFTKKQGSRPYAFAPIRTRPLRNYEPYIDVPGPEGSHVPVILEKIKRLDPEGSKKLLESLDQFGMASGLFKDVEVRRLGKKESDPFQIKVKISGPAFNMIDVGYGVSQVLPIIVDSLREPPGRTFLLQQPEVHLHPKAQAALGSFLGLLASGHRKNFIIETHSDYLLDRIRMDVRDGKSIKPDDVVILYFERINGCIKIHDLRVDENGNIVNSPRSYRQFFLDEERRFLEG